MSIWWSLNTEHPQAEFEISGGPRTAWTDQEIDVWRALGEVAQRTASAIACGEMTSPVTITAGRWDSHRTRTAMWEIVIRQTDNDT